MATRRAAARDQQLPGATPAARRARTWPRPSRVRSGFVARDRHRGRFPRIALSRVPGWCQTGAPECSEATLAMDVTRSITIPAAAGSATPVAGTGALPKVGERFGPYLIRTELGAGGMGAVFKADQIEPVQRPVALKLIRADFQNELAYALFLVERQSLAALDHPYIAQVLDAGMAETGSLYFAMEWIDGAPIDVHCRNERLDLRARVALLAEVCRGVDHAHARGIVHRDLKPANILVERIDGRPVPKIIDFGIAAAPGSETVDRVGTPGYMAPEHARGERVDARADVYALAVTLVDLLVEEGLEHWWLAPAEDRQALIAPGRKPARDDPVAAWPEDLRAILARALDPDPKRRYDRAGALGEDLGAFLGNYPVKARPPTRGYVARCFWRRHRLAATLTVAVAGVVLGLTAYALLGWRTALLERAQATRTVVFLESILESVDPVRARELDKTLMRRVLDEAGARVATELGDHPRAYVRIVTVMARTYLALGDWQAAAALIAAARPIAERHFGADSSELFALDERGLDVLRLRGARVEALAAIPALVARAEGLYGPTADETLALIAKQTRLEAEGGRLNEALELGQAALDRALAAGAPEFGLHSLRVELAQVHVKLGRVDEGLALQRAAHRSLVARYGADDLRVIEDQAEYAALLFIAQRYAEAGALYREAAAQFERNFGPDHQKTLTMKNNLAAALSVERPGEAADLLAQIHERRSAVLGPEHPQTLQTLGNRAAALLRAGRHAEALPVFRAFLAQCDRLQGPNHPSCAERRAGEGKALMELGRYAEAAAVLEDAYRRKSRVEGKQFAGPEHVAQQLAELYRRWGKPAEVERWARLAPAPTPAP